MSIEKLGDVPDMKPKKIKRLNEAPASEQKTPKAIVNSNVKSILRNDYRSLRYSLEPKSQ